MTLLSEAPLPPAAIATPDVNPLRILVCPLCHTPEPTVNQATLDAGGGWTCRRCSQSWDGSRLATVVAYAVWAAEHDGLRTVVA